MRRRRLRISAKPQAMTGFNLDKMPG
jgi:hypothetical protein